MINISRLCQIKRYCTFKYLGKKRFSAGCRNFGSPVCKEICTHSCSFKKLSKPHENCKREFCCRVCETSEGIRKDKCSFRGEHFCDEIIKKKKMFNCKT